MCTPQQKPSSIKGQVKEEICGKSLRKNEGPEQYLSCEISECVISASVVNVDSFHVLEEDCFAWKGIHYYKMAL
jgi:hypothetical protein